MRVRSSVVGWVAFFLLCPSVCFTQKESEQQNQNPEQKPKSPEQKPQKPEQKPQVPPDSQPPPYVDPNKKGGAREVYVRLDGAPTLTELHAGQHLTGRIERAAEIGSQKIPKNAKILIGVVPKPDTDILELQLLSVEFGGKVYKADAEKGVAFVASDNPAVPGGVIYGITGSPMGGVKENEKRIMRVRFVVRAPLELKRPGSE